ncbi:hypothetical protein [Kineosporia sp. NBRC 101677]|uniref:hypothetical protein n=1 Tax=Kineosporia sp. NBRC 101677 TaxID=3032197 RepID=UPI002552E791|nr:hypothetical protein [Kineosporia sp. NBRC 101677]
MTKPAVHLVVGPPDHGVVIFADWLARQTGGHRIHLPGPDALDASVLARIREVEAPVHLQYTEALFGPHTTTAAAAFVRLRSALPGPVGVTLHDLPDPADEPGRYQRRSAGYREVARAADVVCVSSRHELRLLNQLAPEVTSAQVIPLPMAADPVVEPADRPRPRPEVAVFGFIYPGKGHAAVLGEMRDLPEGIALTAIGRLADNHADLGSELTDAAARSGRSFAVTGFLPEAELQTRLRLSAVPVVPATNISASGSLNTWIAAGRRPLVAEGPYTRELAEECPGLLTLYRPGEFAEAAREVLADASKSWLLQPPPPERHESAVAEAYLNVFAPAGVSS